MLIGRSVAAALLAAVVGASACGLRVSPLPDGRPRFSLVDPAIVHDGLTGLDWTRTGNLPGLEHPFAGLTWKEALTFVTDMNAGRHPNLGHDDWRVPQASELLALRRAFVVPRSALACFFDLLDPGCARVIAPEPFVAFDEGEYWSGTGAVVRDGRPAAGAYAPSADRIATNPGPTAWVVDPSGRAIDLPVESPRRIIAVRGPSPQ